MSIHKRPNTTTYVIKCAKSRSKRKVLYSLEEFREWEIGFRADDIELAIHKLLNNSAPMMDQQKWDMKDLGCKVREKVSFVSFSNLDDGFYCLKEEGNKQVIEVHQVKKEALDEGKMKLHLGINIISIIILVTIITLISVWGISGRVCCKKKREVRSVSTQHLVERYNFVECIYQSKDDVSIYRIVV